MVFVQLEARSYAVARYHSVREPTNANCQINDNLEPGGRAGPLGELLTSLRPRMGDVVRGWKPGEPTPERGPDAGAALRFVTGH
jgi:hypothetical protein